MRTFIGKQPRPQGKNMSSNTTLGCCTSLVEGLFALVLSVGQVSLGICGASKGATQKVQLVNWEVPSFLTSQ